MANEVTSAFNTAFRDFEISGMPSSGANKVKKVEARAIGTVIDAEIAELAALATAGIKWLPAATGTIRVRSTANVAIASGLVNGLTLNGVVLATGNFVFLGSQTNPAENGLYTVVASGAASRATFADSAAELSYIGFLIQSGTVGAGESWTLPIAAASITLGTTPLTFSQTGVADPYAAEITAARGGEVDLDTRLDKIDLAVDVVEAAVVPLSAPIPAAPSTVIYALLDANDNAALALRADGTINIGTTTVTSLNDVPATELRRRLRRTVRMRSSIAHWISYGQSLSLGNGSSIMTFPGSFFDAVMFNANGVATAGPRAQDGGADVALNHASLIPYEERPLTGTAPSGNMETPLGNAIHLAKSLLIEENGIYPADEEYVILGSAPGQSNTSIDALDKPSAYYTRLITDVTYGLSLATAAGKSFAVDIVFWSQGEADIAAMTRATYLTKLQTLYTDLNTDIKALTGQAHDIKMILYAVTTYDQTNTNIALAQVDAALANSNIHVATAIYAMEHLAANNVHMHGIGYSQLGAYYGYCAKRVVLDGDTWPVFIPSRITRQGTILDVEFPDTGFPIAISDYLFPSQTNAGLTAIDGASADNPITSVTVIGKRRLRVVLTSAVAGKLRYCFASWGGNLHNLNPTDHHSARKRLLYQPVLPFEVSFA